MQYIRRYFISERDSRREAEMGSASCHLANDVESKERYTTHFCAFILLIFSFAAVLSV